MSTTAIKPIRVLIAAKPAELRRRLQRACAADPALERVGEARDGPAAVVLASATRPDVVLADVTLLLPDGAAITQALLAAEPGARIIVLGWPRHEARVLEALRLGARGHLLADADPPGIAAAVQAVHGGEARLDARLTARLLSELRHGWIAERR